MLKGLCWDAVLAISIISISGTMMALVVYVLWCSLLHLAPVMIGRGHSWLVDLRYDRLVQRQSPLLDGHHQVQDLAGGNWLMQHDQGPWWHCG